MSAPRFDELAADYAAARPHYPADIVRVTESVVGPLRDHRLLDVAAGTGHATCRFAPRVRATVAVDRSRPMLAYLLRTLPATPCAVADGHALPFCDGTFTLVTYAQAWHWMDVPVAAAEAARVLDHRGHLLLIWNDVDQERAPWIHGQLDRLEDANRTFCREYRHRDYAAELEDTSAFTVVRRLTILWERLISLETYVAWLRSKSYVAALGDRRDAFIDGERRVLRRHFPDERILEPFRTTLYIARRSPSG